MSSKYCKITMFEIYFIPFVCISIIHIGSNLLNVKKNCIQHNLNREEQFFICTLLETKSHLSNIQKLNENVSEFEIYTGKVSGFIFKPTKYRGLLDSA